MKKLFLSIKRNYIWVIICILCFLSFIVILSKVNNNTISTFDEEIYNIVISLKSDWLTSFLKVFTYLASSYFLIAICILSIFIIKKRKYSLIIILNIINTTIISQIIKYLVCRNRPVDISLITETGYSFPSGHSVAAMSFYGFLIFLFYNSNLNKKKKTILISILSIIIFIVGYSRVYLGVHYASDVISAFCLTVSYLIIFTQAIKRNKKIALFND